MKEETIYEDRGGDKLIVNADKAGTISLDLHVGATSATILFSTHQTRNLIAVLRKAIRETLPNRRRDSRLRRAARSQ